VSANIKHLAVKSQLSQSNMFFCLFVDEKASIAHVFSKFYLNENIYRTYEYLVDAYFSQSNCSEKQFW
jgi:hypothetical protein